MKMVKVKCPQCCNRYEIPEIADSSCAKCLVKLVIDHDIETQGVRQNQGKPMFSPIDPNLMLEIAKGLQIGQEKYGDKAFNKEGNVMNLTTGYDSLMRHLHNFMAGEDIDTDDNVHHLAKVINCAVVMWHNREQGDDR